MGGACLDRMSVPVLEQKEDETQTQNFGVDHLDTEESELAFVHWSSD